MKKESFIYSTLTIGGSKEQVNEVMKYICDDIYDIGSIQRAENFLQVTSRPGSLNSLFHFRVLTFVFPIFARVIPPG